MQDLNVALFLRALLGITEADRSGPSRQPSFTKKGPGRRHQQGKKAKR